MPTSLKLKSRSLSRNWCSKRCSTKCSSRKPGLLAGCMVNWHSAKPKSATNHIILGVVTDKRREFASQMNLGLNNGWGVVGTIVDLVRGMSADEDGNKKYVLVKDLNKQVIGCMRSRLRRSQFQDSR